MCERWTRSFEAFWEDMGNRPAGMTLDRIDTNGDYAPENCRWATKKEQANNRRGNVFLSSHGISDTISGWARRLGIRQDRMYKLSQYRGKSVDEICADLGIHHGKADLAA